MNLARYIDHTLLKVNATQKDIENLCLEAKNNNFRAVCINPYWVRTAANILRGSATAVATVVGFPLGSTPTETKVEETHTAICAGAEEIDMVMNVGAFLSGDEEAVERDIREVFKAVKQYGEYPFLKVILEVRCLTDEQIRRATEICANVGVHFVKTCTGFGPDGGATVNDIQIMKSAIKEGMEIKASGGIRDYKTAKALIEAGATRIGTSSGVAIMNGATGSSGY